MFTGIIEELGEIVSLEKHGGGARIKIGARLVTDGTSEGDSIAVNGVCLTAIGVTPLSFAADVSGETLRRSTLGGGGRLSVGARVNLERAVTPATRLGGHIVQGHVDGVGKFLQAARAGDFWTVRVGYGSEIAPYLIYKGSIAVEGISLTVAALGEDYFEIAVIPKTWQMTNLSTLKPGDAVNLEADVIAKYVERILLCRDREGRQPKTEDLTMEKLKNLGFA